MLTKRFAHPLGTVLCVCALLLISSTSYSQPKGKTREISGTVVDVESQPVANATVTVSGGGPSAMTGTDGAFTLTAVATTNLTIEVTAEGFKARQIPVLGAATALSLQLVIAKPAPVAPPPVETRMVGGVVSDGAHAPIAGATVRVHGGDIQAVTGADGSFTLPGVAIGEVTLDVEASGQPAVGVAVPADRAAVVVTIGAPPPAAPPPPTTRSIHGKVVEESSGQPLAAAQVQIVGIPSATLFTEADGTFVFENVPAGPVAIDVTAPEHESHLLDVPAAKDTLTVSLGPR